MLRYKYRLNEDVVKQLQKLNPEIRSRIVKKLDWFCEQESPLKFARKLIDSELGSFRFRVGDLRVIFDVDEDNSVLRILMIDHRRDIYR